MADTDRNFGIPGRYRPAADEVDDLIRRAAAHPLGTDFLIKGALDAVAATFQVHAFAVEAAREVLLAPEHVPDIKTAPVVVHATPS